MRHLLAIGCGALLAGSCLPDGAAADAGPLPPGRLVDYRSLAFQPEVWEQRRVSTLLSPWTGSNVVFLTTNGTYDPVLMTRWVSRLDQGWALYADLTGARPRPFKQLDGRAVIAAVPGFEFTCGAGCGYVGTTGWNWLVAASVAARKDLSPVFVEDWRLPLSAATRKELAAVDWSAPELSVPAILGRIQPRWEAAP